ncbi:MAG: DUF177 domain-containing protein, partial [Deltaproteobacteria bacterium]|nr:DUF177 domain-containing protein [Deltaproteobacteria bacterium]
SALKNAAERGLVLADPISLLDIPEEGLLFEENLPKDWIDAEIAVGLPPDTAPHATSEVTVRVEVETLGEMSDTVPIRVRGHAVCNIEATCVRCLDPVHVELRPKIDATMTPNSAPEEETLAYDPRAIDLMAPVREALLLDVPMNPTCVDTQACDHRTKALIDAVNGPQDEQTGSEDPRWAALRKLAGPKID